MRIGELAKTAGVGVETVRYYQRIKLLKIPAKPYRGIRNYSRDDLARLRFIRRAQHLGFSLNEITALLKLSRADCTNVQSLARKKLEIVRGKVDDLRRMSKVLEDVLARCASRQPHEGCPIIETLSKTAS
jgi:MerR family transcriptional regulator, mercuric resistance operon regulatory protein